MKKVNVLVLVIGLIIIGNAIPLNALNGRDIMIMVDERDDGDDRSCKMEMTLINKRGSKRVRKISSYSKDYGDDEKKIMVFQHPADVKGTGFLSWEYDNESKEDDRWLYMPALRKTRRISSSSDDDYFMGSDFTYDDLGNRSVDEDTHTLLREEELKGHKCWVVESIPKKADNQYNRKIVWIRQDVLISIKIEFHDDLGIMKILEIGDIKQVNNIWTAHDYLMDNRRDNHKTHLVFSDFSYNSNLDDNMFTVSTIKRGNLK